MLENEVQCENFDAGSMVVGKNQWEEGSTARLVEVDSRIYRSASAAAAWADGVDGADSKDECRH